ncbi:MAG: hypothetical protein Q4D38_05110 [Planctomycetia bacterium]|nr:hypothetical protein [Planctomycetia bacterium]
MSERINCNSKELRKNALTKRQRAVLDFIKECICERGIAPTIREIGDEFGIHSPNGVVGHLLALQRKGFIERKTNSSRAILLKDVPRMNFSPNIEGILHCGRIHSCEEMDAAHPNVSKLSIMSTENRIIIVGSNEYAKKYGICQNDYLLIQPAKIPEQERLNIVQNDDGTYEILRFNEVVNQRFSKVLAVVVALLRNQFFVLCQDDKRN